MSESFCDSDLVPLNDHAHNYRRQNDSLSNLDLIFVSACMIQTATFEVLPDSFTSYHFPVIATLDIEPEFVRSCANRFNVEKVDWGGFSGLMEWRKKALLDGMERWEYTVR